MTINTESIFPSSSTLDTRSLQHLFDNMSECYKLFWFEAIVNEVVEENTVISYDTLVNDMIASAWYMVCEYRLNLGPNDTLEAAVHMAQGLTRLKSSEKKEKIIAAISSCTDMEFLKKKQTLTYNVPYRLQSPFLPEIKGTVWNLSQAKLAQVINDAQNNIYQFGPVSGLASTIEVKPAWAEYIRANLGVILGWIRYNMINYLQRRNPSVPGISCKLEPPLSENLNKVRDFWRIASEITDIHEIYGGSAVDIHDISIDHFVPWSYLAHDELWNLSPTTRSINSQKSNNLPEWDIYFPQLCDIEYKAYSAVHESEKLREAFEKCLRDHVNSDDVRLHLYREGIGKDEYTNRLEKLILPAYKAAENMGFAKWRLT